MMIKNVFFMVGFIRGLLRWILQLYIAMVEKDVGIVVCALENNPLYRVLVPQIGIYQQKMNGLNYLNMWADKKMPEKL